MLVVGLAVFGLATGCSSSSSDVDSASEESEPTTSADGDTSSESDAEQDSDPVEAVGEASTFTIEVWADNWMAVSIDGQLIGEDSVPITTERSFNAETFTFEATYPFTIGIEAKDFKETDSGIEYIGLDRQQMGDGGLIAQVTDTETGQVVAVTNADWSVLVVHRAPLNPECATDADPDATCQYEITETPAGWADPDFDDSSWATATEWTADAVDPKDGYGEITWSPDAQFIWGSDLEIDNTILTRMTVESS